jgi:hypothetical protein
MSVSALQWDIDGSGYHGRHPRADMEREEREEDMQRRASVVRRVRRGHKNICQSVETQH